MTRRFLGRARQARSRAWRSDFPWPRWYEWPDCRSQDGMGWYILDKAQSTALVLIYSLMRTIWRSLRLLFRGSRYFYPSRFPRIESLLTFWSYCVLLAHCLPSSVRLSQGQNWSTAAWALRLKEWLARAIFSVAAFRLFWGGLRSTAVGIEESHPWFHCEETWRWGD